MFAPIQNDHSSTVCRTFERRIRGLQGSGHVGLDRMADDSLPKRARELREQGRRRRGKPMMRWKDCVKRCEERRETGRRRQETEEGGKD